MAYYRPQVLNDIETEQIRIPRMTSFWKKKTLVPAEALRRFSTRPMNIPPLCPIKRDCSPKTLIGTHCYIQRSSKKAQQNYALRPSLHSSVSSQHMALHVHACGPGRTISCLLLGSPAQKESPATLATASRKHPSLDPYRARKLQSRFGASQFLKSLVPKTGLQFLALKRVI